MKLYPFPGPLARETVKKVIEMYAQKRISRQVMMNFLALILKKHNATKMVIDNYVIYIEKRFFTLEYPVVLFELLRRGEVCEACPVCGNDGFDYLAGEPPVISAWCRGCGCIYEREVQDDETSNEGPECICLGEGD